MRKLDIDSRVFVGALALSIGLRLGGCEMAGTKSDNAKQPIESDQVTIEATEEPPIESEQVVIETTEEPPTESDQVTISGDEYISLGDSEHPLKLLCIIKGEEIAVGFGNFRWDYKDASQSASESTGFDFDEKTGTFCSDANTDLYNLWFDNVLTGESVNLNMVEATATDEVRFYYTDAGNYFSLQSVIDNAVSRTELEEFVDSCTIGDWSARWQEFRNIDVDKFSVFDALTDSKLDSTMGNEPLAKIKK